jgi:MFS family permease
METSNGKTGKFKWLNSTVVGIGIASLFSDWAHEIATTVLPSFLATMGVAAMWLGIIEGVADGLSSFAKLASGYYTDKLRREKPVAVIGYIVTALGTASFGLATAAWHILIARSVAWLGRGVRTPVRKALLSGAVTPETYGRAFGFERMMDTIGAIVGPASAFILLQMLNFHYPSLFALTLIPGMLAAFAIAFLVKETKRKPVSYSSFFQGAKLLPGKFRKFLGAVFLFGMGDFAPSL